MIRFQSFRSGMLFVLLAFSFTSFGCANPLQETHHNPPAPEIEDDTDETESGNKGSSDKEDENNSESGNGDNGDEDSESETEGGDENEPDPDGEGGPETGNNGEDNSASGDTESEDGGDQNIEDEKPVEENYPEITGFTFTPPQTKIRYSHAVKGRQAGLVGDPVGGTAPFTYSLVSGVNQDISHNDQFAFDGTVLKIQDYGLSIGEYRITIGVTDVHGKTFGKTVTVTVHPDPVLGERKVHEINGIRFAIRYVNQGTYIKDGMQGSIGQVDRGFWMAETETTRELFKAVMGFDPSNSRPRPIPGVNDNHKPVDGVTYSEAVVFANRLSLLTGREPVYQVYGINDWLNIPEWAIETIGNSYIAKSNEADGYRLPTEYEWEWAAMGADKENPGQMNIEGHKKYFAGGQESSRENMGDYVWFMGNSNNATQVAGQKLPNELGLFDLCGNVREYVEGMNGQIHAKGSAFNIPENSINIMYNTTVNAQNAASLYMGIRFVTGR